ncbi:hypothetical protein ACJX0J_020664, partial [Zea mays]
MARLARTQDVIILFIITGSFGNNIAEHPMGALGVEIPMGAALSLDYPAPLIPGLGKTHEVTYRDLQITYFVCLAFHHEFYPQEEMQKLFDYRNNLDKFRILMKRPE